MSYESLFHPKTNHTMTSFQAIISFCNIADVIALKLFGQTKIEIKPGSKLIMWESFRALSPPKKPTKVLQTKCSFHLATATSSWFSHSIGQPEESLPRIQQIKLDWGESDGRDHPWHRLSVNTWLTCLFSHISDCLCLRGRWCSVCFCSIYVLWDQIWDYFLDLGKKATSSRIWEWCIMGLWGRQTWL